MIFTFVNLWICFSLLNPSWRACWCWKSRPFLTYLAITMSSTRSYKSSTKLATTRVSQRHLSYSRRNYCSRKAATVSSGNSDGETKRAYLRTISVLSKNKKVVYFKVLLRIRLLVDNNKSSRIENLPWSKK